MRRGWHCGHTSLTAFLFSFKTLKSPVPKSIEEYLRELKALRCLCPEKQPFPGVLEPQGAVLLSLREVIKALQTPGPLY